MTTAVHSESRIVELARALATRAGAGDVSRIQRLEHGTNNRAYRLDTRDRSFFLKAYRSDAADPRPRLQTEFGFLRFAWSQGVRTIPEPMAMDAENNLGLYGFIGGRRLSVAEIGRKQIEQAARFVAELNRSRETAVALELPVASEACFSLRRHLELIEERVRRLRSIEDLEAAAVVREQLTPLWQQVSQRFRQTAAEAGLLDEADLPQRQRCLSPSDLGFHNAIDNAGRLIFCDFEYAGWDDPAKLVCDFLCQPEVPIAPADAPFAVDRLLAAVDSSDIDRRRAELLQPLYIVKWCCICLNDFLPAAARRRHFAGTEQPHLQLAKVKAFMERLPRV